MYQYLYQPQQIFDGKEFILPPLPYDYKALEPYIDEATMKAHHDKHHASYVKGANNAMKKMMAVADGSEDESLAAYWGSQFSFHASGHIMHSIFWNNMTPDAGGKPSGDLAKAINDSYGSFDNFLKIFKAAAAGVQGSGWAVMGYNPAYKMLCVHGIKNHQDCTVQGMTPLLVLDVWEHAYYLKHQSDRATYIKDFVEIINWDDVAKRLEVACKGQ